MRPLRSLVLSLLMLSGCSPLQLQHSIDPLQALASAQTDQIVIAETGALVSQIASVDLYLNGEFIGNTGDTAVVMATRSEGPQTLVVKGRFGAAYADPTTIQLEPSDGHQFVLIEPTVQGPIRVRVVSRVQWEALAK